MAARKRVTKQPMTDAGSATVRREYADNWTNLWQGYGVEGRDKSTATRFEQRGMLSWSERTALYRQNWIGKRVVDDLAADATRAGFAVGVAENDELPEQTQPLYFLRVVFQWLL